MKYRLALVNVSGLERPKEIYSQELGSPAIDEWMEGVLKEHPDGKVEIYQTEEVLVHRVSGRVSETGGVVLNSESLLDPR